MSEPVEVFAGDPAVVISDDRVDASAAVSVWPACPARGYIVDVGHVEQRSYFLVIDGIDHRYVEEEGEETAGKGAGGQPSGSHAL